VFLEIIKQSDLLHILIGFGQLYHPELECLIFNLLRKIFTAGGHTSHVRSVVGSAVNYLKRIMLTKLVPRLRLPYHDTKSVYNVLTILTIYVKTESDTAILEHMLLLVANIYMLCKQRMYIQTDSFSAMTTRALQIDDFVLHAMAHFILDVLYQSNQYFNCFAYLLSWKYGFVAFDAVAHVLAAETNDKLCISILYDLFDTLQDDNASEIHYCEQLHIPKMLYELQLRNSFLDNYKKYKFCYNLFDS
jgi:hypothetical protein